MTETTCECGQPISPKVLEYCTKKGMKKILCYDCQKSMESPLKTVTTSKGVIGGYVGTGFGPTPDRRSEIERGQDINNTHEFLTWFIGSQLSRREGSVDEKLYRTAFEYWFSVINGLNDWARKYNK